MRTIVLILICAISLNSVAQKTVANAGIRDKVMKVWIMEEGYFPMNKIRFRTYQPQKDSASFYTSYQFKEGGEIGYEFHVPRGIGVCGNGLQMVQHTKWTLKGKSLRVYIKGGYMAEGTFEWDALYEIEKLTDDELVLKRIKLFKNRRCETCAG